MKANTMRRTSILGVSLSLILIPALAGCSSPGSAQNGPEETEEEVQPVVYACSADLGGMEAEITVSAPAEDETVETMIMELTLPASYFGMDDLSELDDSLLDDIISSLAQSLGVSENDITAELTDETLKVDVSLNQKSMKTALNLDDGNDSMILQDLIRSLESEGGAECQKQSG